MEIFQTKEDFTTSLVKSLDEANSKWEEYPGLIIAGTHAPFLIADKIDKIQEYREKNMPVLGICFGMQLMLIEYARNVLKLKQANTEEVDEKAHNMIIKNMPKLRVGAFKVKGNLESHWHKCQFNNKYKSVYKKTWNLTYTDEVLEIAKLAKNKFHLGVQFHPGYQSSKKNSHYILTSFIKTCRKS